MCQPKLTLRPHSLPIWSCSVWGLPCLAHRYASGALLPHLFTLTPPILERAHALARMSGAVCSLWHFPSNGLQPILPDVIRHTALWSSDFPLPFLKNESDRPVQLPTFLLYAIRF